MFIHCAAITHYSILVINASPLLHLNQSDKKKEILVGNVYSGKVNIIILQNKNSTIENSQNIFPQKREKKNL